jgi:ketosteroid isomerase-like protein
MTQAASRTIELVSQLCDAFSTRDIGAALELTDADVRFTTLAGRAGAEIGNGHEGLRQWFTKAAEAWEYMRAHVNDVEERDGWAIVSGNTHAGWRLTGDEVKFDWTAIGRAEDGVLVEFGIYFTREEALAALGPG